jgi:PAS domain S-box-containing protein
MTPPADEPKEWHQNVVEAAPVPVVLYDAVGVIQYVNGATVEFANAPDRDALVGEEALSFVHEEDRSVTRERVGRVLEGREAVEPLEVRFVVADGTKRHAIVASAPVTYQGEPAGEVIIKDITDRKHRERQLRRERDRFELLFENLPSAAVHGVAREGEPIVERVNERFEEVFGYDQSTVVGENLDEFIVPDDAREEAAALNERIIDQGFVQTEVTRETAEGPREFLLQVVMREFDDGPPEGYSIYTDITEQKEAERELARKNERLNDFAGVVSHDLRNPLQVADARTDLARKTGDLGHLEKVADSLDRMRVLIDDLLEQAHGNQTLQARMVSLAVIAEDAWTGLSTPDASLSVPEDARLQADPNRLRQLLENLFRNAMDHAGPAVTVTVGGTSEGFYVADDGPGIPPEERSAVFGSGYSGNDGGTGLGLTIVQRIAEVHGWTIDITDSSSGGARFEIAGVDVVD